MAPEQDPMRYEGYQLDDDRFFDLCPVGQMLYLQLQRMGERTGAEVSIVCEFAKPLGLVFRPAARLWWVEFEFDRAGMLADMRVMRDEAADE